MPTRPPPGLYPVENPDFLVSSPPGVCLAALLEPLNGVLVVFLRDPEDVFAHPPDAAAERLALLHSNEVNRKDPTGNAGHKGPVKRQLVDVPVAACIHLEPIEVVAGLQVHDS